MSARNEGVKSHQPTRPACRVLVESSIVLRTIHVGPRLEITVQNSNGHDDCKYLLTLLISVLHQWFKHERGDPIEITRLSTERFA